MSAKVQRFVYAMTCAFALCFVCLGTAYADEGPQLSFDVDSPHEYAPGEAIELKAVSDGLDGCAFKFVWQKDGWAQWGIARSFDSDPSCVWTPDEAGTYTLYLDVLYEDGAVETISRELDLTEDYAFMGVSCSAGASMIEGAPATVSADVSGNTASLQYKFVWQKDGWTQWGVLQELSPASEAVWTPNAGSGTYVLYVDIVDSTGTWTTWSYTYVVDTVVLESPLGMQISYEAGMEVPLRAIAADDADAQFKFVWQKDGWAKWGVIRGLDEDPSCTWQPAEAGDYTIYLDAIDASGTATTVTLEIVLTEEWEFDGVVADPESPQPFIVGEGTDFTVLTSGNNGSLQYKFVWQKDNWAKWGVARGMSPDPTCHWDFTGVGTYTLYIDICDSTGTVTTYTDTYTVTRAWTFDGIVLSAESQPAGESVTVSAQVSGETDGLRYKFVWSRNGSWASEQWGVLQQASAQSSATLTPTQPGLYTLVVDIIEPDGTYVTESVAYSAWKLIGAKAQLKGNSSSLVGFDVVITPDFGGANPPEGFTYKYVWRKGASWAQWGVIANQSANASVTWRPTAGAGSYTFYVDVLSPEGEAETVTASVTILDIVKDIRWSLAHGTKTAQYQKYIVLHDTEGDGGPSTVIAGWISDGNYVAAHFIIGKDGTIYQCVPMDQIAHHAGYGDTGHNRYYGVTDESRDDKRGTTPIGSWARDYGMNSYSIGIELVHSEYMGYYPEAQLDALDALISYIDDYYGFESTIIDHKMWRSGNSDTSPEFERYLANYRDHRTHD